MKLPLSVAKVCTRFDHSGYWLYSTLGFWILHGVVHGVVHGVRPGYDFSGQNGLASIFFFKI